jgi:hypothetical protein
MPTIELTTEEAEEVRDVLSDAIDQITTDRRMFDTSDADDIAAMHRLAVLERVLNLLEIS